MDRKQLRPNRKGNKPTNRNLKNAGFIALLVLFGIIIIAAANQPSNLKEIPATTAISDANAGKYSKIQVSGNELDITPKDKDHATLKTFVDANSSLKDQGFDTRKRHREVPHLDDAFTCHGWKRHCRSLPAQRPACGSRLKLRRWRG